MSEKKSETTSATPATVTPAPDPAPAKKPRKTPSNIDQTDLAIIKKVRTIAQTAQDPAYLPALTDPEKGAVAPGEPAALEADTTTVETGTGAAVALAKAAKQQSTADENASRKKFTGALRIMQNAARRKFGDQPEKLKAYFIGDHEFDSTRAKLEVNSQAMLNLAATDNLPGITATVLATDNSLRTAWIKADDDQQEAIKAQATAVAAFDKAVASLQKRGIDIQLAANSTWPYTDPTNAVVRRAFQIPENKPYLG